MAKRENKTKVIGQVKGLRVVQTPTFHTERGEKTKKIISTKIGIFAGKKEIESGFRNKESAMGRAKLLSK